MTTGRPRGVASALGLVTAYGRLPRHHNGGGTREVRPASSTRSTPPVQPLLPSPGMAATLEPPRTRPTRGGTSRGGGPSSSSPCSGASAGAAVDDGRSCGGVPRDRGGGQTARHSTPVSAVGPRGWGAPSTRPGAAWPTRGGPIHTIQRCVRDTLTGALSAARLALPGRRPMGRWIEGALAPWRGAVRQPWWSRKSGRAAAATGTPGRGPTPGWSAAPRRVPRSVCSVPRRARNSAGPTRLATTGMGVKRDLDYPGLDVAQHGWGVSEKGALWPSNTSGHPRSSEGQPPGRGRMQTVIGSSMWWQGRHVGTDEDTRKGIPAAPIKEHGRVGEGRGVA